MQQFVTTDPAHSCDSNSTELLDSFRYLHPSREKAYTCWSTLLDSRKINYGTRIDYVLLSKSLSGHLKRAEVWQEIEGSDHCPVFAELAINLVPSQTPPSLCSKYFSAGKQTKLSDFLVVRKSPKSGESGVTTSSKLLGKRSVSTVGPPPSAKASKSGSGKIKVNPQQSVVSFFKPVSHDKQSKDQASDFSAGDERMCKDSFTSSGENASTSSQESSQSSSQSEAIGSGGRGKLHKAWLGVFGGPPKPPLCSKHNEPCVLRTVKKQGPNKNKQFWVCSRPGGGKGDPQAKCDFFQWRNTKRK